MTPLDYLVVLVAGSGLFMVIRALGVGPVEDRQIVSRDLARRRWR